MTEKGKQQSKALRNLKEEEEERLDLLDKCNQIFTKIRSDFNLKFPTDSYIQFNRQYATHMKKEFDLFALCMEEVSQTYEIDGERMMSMFLNNILITIKCMLFTQLRCFLNYLDQNIQLNDARSLTNWEASEISRLSRHKVKVLRGTVDEEVIRAQEANLISDPTEEIKKRLGVEVDPLLREHQLSKKELLDVLEEKRRNLNLKESKAGRVLKKQIEGFKTQVSKETKYVTTFEEKFLASVKHLAISDGTTQMVGILNDITENLDKNARGKLMKVLDFLFSNAKSQVFKKKNSSAQTTVFGSQIDDSENKLVKMSRKVYDAEKNVENLLKEVANKDKRIIELEKKIQDFKKVPSNQTGNAHSTGSANNQLSGGTDSQEKNPLQFRVDDLLKQVEKLTTDLAGAVEDKQYYQGKVFELKQEVASPKQRFLNPFGDAELNIKLEDKGVQVMLLEDQDTKDQKSQRSTSRNRLPLVINTNLNNFGQINKDIKTPSQNQPLMSSKSIVSPKQQSQVMQSPQAISGQSNSMQGQSFFNSSNIGSANLQDEALTPVANGIENVVNSNNNFGPSSTKGNSNFRNEHARSNSGAQLTIGGGKNNRSTHSEFENIDDRKSLAGQQIIEERESREGIRKPEKEQSKINKQKEKKQTNPQVIISSNEGDQQVENFEVHEGNRLGESMVNDKTGEKLRSRQTSGKKNLKDSVPKTSKQQQTMQSQQQEYGVQIQQSSVRQPNQQRQRGTKQDQSESGTPQMLSSGSGEFIGSQNTSMQTIEMNQMKGGESGVDHLKVNLKISSKTNPANKNSTKPSKHVNEANQNREGISTDVTHKLVSSGPEIDPTSKNHKQNNKNSKQIQLSQTIHQKQQTPSHNQQEFQRYDEQLNSNNQDQKNQFIDNKIDSKILSSKEEIAEKRLDSSSSAPQLIFQQLKRIESEKGLFQQQQQQQQVATANVLPMINNSSQAVKQPIHSQDFGYLEGRLDQGENQQNNIKSDGTPETVNASIGGDFLNGTMNNTNSNSLKSNGSLNNTYYNSNYNYTNGSHPGQGFIFSDGTFGGTGKESSTSLHSKDTFNSISQNLKSPTDMGGSLPPSFFRFSLPGSYRTPQMENPTDESLNQNNLRYMSDESILGIGVGGAVSTAGKSRFDMSDFISLFDLEESQEIDHSKQQSTQIFEVLSNKANPKRREVINAIVAIIQNKSSSSRGTGRENQSHQKFPSFNGVNNSIDGQSPWGSMNETDKYPQSTKANNSNGGNGNSTQGIVRKQSRANLFPLQLEKIEQNPLESSLNTTKNFEVTTSPKNKILAAIHSAYESSSSMNSTGGQLNRKNQTQIERRYQQTDKKLVKGLFDSGLIDKQTEQEKIRQSKILQQQEVLHDIIRKKNQIAISRFNPDQHTVNSTTNGSLERMAAGLNTQTQSFSQSNLFKTLNLVDAKKKSPKSLWRPKQDEFRYIEKNSSLLQPMTSTTTLGIHSVQNQGGVMKVVGLDSVRRKNNHFKKALHFTEEDPFVKELFEHLKERNMDFGKLKELEISNTITKSMNNLNSVENSNVVAPSLYRVKKKIGNDEPISIDEFLEYFSDVITQHRRCGPYCFHLRRFYEKVDFNVKLFEKRQQLICPTLIVSEITRSSVQKTNINLLNEH